MKTAWRIISKRGKADGFVCDACFDVSGIKIGVDFAIADAGATGHFLVPGAPVKNMVKAAYPLSINLPQGEVIKSTHEGVLDIPWLPAAARKAHIVPDLVHSSLVSIRELCNAGCKVHYDGDYVNVIYEGKIVWQGVKEPTTDLWFYL